MHIFLAAALSCGHLSSPLQEIQHIHQDGSELMQLLHQQMDDCDLNDFTETALQDLSAGDLIFLGPTKAEIHTMGIYGGSDTFVRIGLIKPISIIPMQDFMGGIMRLPIYFTAFLEQKVMRSNFWTEVIFLKKSFMGLMMSWKKKPSVLIGRKMMS